MSRSAAALLIFAASAGIMIVEITAARLLAPALGTTVHVWAAVIAFVLLGLAIGNWFGGRQAAALTRATARLSRAFFLAAIGTLASWILIASLPPLTVRPWSLAVPVLALPFAIPAMATGMVKPIATALALNHAQSRSGRIIGAMYAANAAGAVLGTFLSGFVFAAFLGLSETMIGTAGIFLLCAAILSVARTAARLPSEEGETP